MLRGLQMSQFQVLALTSPRHAPYPRSLRVGKPPVRLPRRAQQTRTGLPPPSY